MSKSINIFDIIAAATGNDPIVALSKLQYGTIYSIDDFEDDDLITKRVLSGFGGGSVSVQVKIPAGSTIPFNIALSSYPTLSNTAPTQVLAEINDNVDGTIDDTTLVEFTDIKKKKNFVDNTYAVLTSIDIYGHPDDATGLVFNEDTYVTLFQ